MLSPVFLHLPRVVGFLFWVFCFFQIWIYSYLCICSYKYKSAILIIVICISCLDISMTFKSICSLLLSEAKKCTLRPDYKHTGNENWYNHVYFSSVEQYTYQISSASKYLQSVSKYYWSCTRKGCSRSGSTLEYSLRRQGFIFTE